MSEINFGNITLNAKTKLALAKLNFTEPTEVQQKGIPLIIQGKNLLIRSHTGTGKTAAFGIGLIERLANGTTKKGLILTPTRELAVQVCKELSALSSFHGFNSVPVYGGEKIERQIYLLQKGYNILVATPGRYQDLRRRGEIDVSEFNLVVLDEADQMLDLGFRDDVCFILDELPAQKVVVLVSATLEDSVLQIANKYAKQYVSIEVGEVSIAPTIEEQNIEVTAKEKYPALIKLIHAHKDAKILIFRETKKATNNLQYNLERDGYKVGALEGDMSQQKRNNVLTDFKEGRLNILVATNVAARGLHIDDLNLIVNYDMASTDHIHMHRVGRVGRMGKDGKAINFVTRREEMAERMHENHPDFEWMKGGGSESYRKKTDRFDNKNRRSSGNRVGHRRNTRN